MLRETDRDALYYAPVYYTTRARDTYDAPFEVCCNHEHATPLVPRQLYLPVGVNQFCRFTSLAWTRCWAALVR